MLFQKNILKQYLKNVYFITGMPCGGKTTVSRALGKMHGLLVYDADVEFARHKKNSSGVFQPAMNTEFKNADEFFGRTVEEYKQWLIDCTREQLDFVLLDLIRLSEKQTVLCDCHLTIEQAEELTDTSRVVFLLREPTDIVEEYCHRADHNDFKEFLNSSTDVEKAKCVCNDAIRTAYINEYNRVKESSYYWIERNDNKILQDTIKEIDAYFGF